MHCPELLKKTRRAFGTMHINTGRHVCALSPCKRWCLPNTNLIAMQVQHTFSKMDSDSKESSVRNASASTADLHLLEASSLSTHQKWHSAIQYSEAGKNTPDPPTHTIVRHPVMCARSQRCGGSASRKRQPFAHNHSIL